ncbi:MAG: DUF2834 domain-containing protein [Pseudomonadota bacterium]
MLVRKTGLIALLLPFAGITALAVKDFGIVGIFEHFLANSAGWQGFADLVVALTLTMSWMIADARRLGRNVWPFIGVTFVLGSFGPLAYLLTRRQAATDVSN